MAKIHIHFISGICDDRVKITINDLLVLEYAYGYNASYNREFAKYAEQDIESAKKYDWKGTYTSKPFIGDILDELMEKYQPDEIVYSGHCVFPQRKMTGKEIQEKIARIEKER